MHQHSSYERVSEQEIEDERRIYSLHVNIFAIKIFLVRVFNPRGANNWNSMLYTILNNRAQHYRSS